MATNVSAKLKETFETAKTQLNGFEKKFEKKVDELEKKAKSSLNEVKENLDGVPTQLKGRWETIISRIRAALDFATKDDLKTLTDKVDDLAKKVEKLIRETARAVNAKVNAKPNAKRA